jgi:hypothetical protein
VATSNLGNREAAPIENPHARRGGFGFVDGSPCRECGRRFSSSKARRRHERRAHQRSVPPEADLDGSRQPGDTGEVSDPLDDPHLKGDPLRTAVNRRLRYLAGLSETP